MDVVPDVDSFAVFTLVAQHLYAEELGRVAQVSKALRVAADSDESWQLSYGVSKTKLRGQVNEAKLNWVLAIAEHRFRLVELSNAQDYVCELTRTLAKGVILDYTGPGLGASSLWFAGSFGPHEVLCSSKKGAMDMWENSEYVLGRTGIREITQEEFLAKERVNQTLRLLAENIARLHR